MKNIPINMLLSKILLSFFITGLFSMCSPSAKVKAQSANNNNLPYFGFNAKGTLNADEQTNYTNDLLDQITQTDIKKNLPIRVTGGTLSQTTYKNDWTLEIIHKWVALQKKQGIRFIYVVNGNDEPANQAAIIKEWLSAGAHFDFIEMMNEYYLPKFARGDKSFKEVTEQVSPEKYVDTILPKFWKELDQFKLPYYLIFAPRRTDPKANEYLQHWNEVLSDAVIKKYPERNLNAVIHLYLKEETTVNRFDYDQIDAVRKQLPAGRYIAITEAGVINKELDYQAAADLTINHYRQILKHLIPGDYLLDQVLYNASKNNNTALVSPEFSGETPKGKAMIKFINGELK